MKSFTKIFVGLFAGAVLLSGAAFAQASSLTQTQVQAIISLLQSFGADPSTINNVSVALTGNASGGSGGYGNWGTCPTLSANLYLGVTDSMTGGQVSLLQRYLGVNPTGYFGTLTRAAVANFQTQYQVYPVTGGVGPLTRAAIARVCGGGSTTGSSFIFNSAFTLGVGQQATESSQGQLTVQLLSISGNTAQVTLGQNCARGTQCFYYPTQTVTMGLNQPMTFQSYAVNMVAVSGNTATFFASNSNSSMGGNASLNASPTSGNVPLSVNFSASVPQSGNYVIDYGDGTNSGQLNLIYPPCAASATSCYPQANVSHIYQNAGTYTASLSTYIACLYSNPRCMIAQPAPIATVTITVGGGMTGCTGTCAPVIASISPTSGPIGTVVTIRGTGFTNDNTIHFGVGGAMHVASQNGTTLTYTVPSEAGPCSFVGDTSQVHCMAAVMLVSPGTYNISVSNANGQSAAQSFTVTGSQSVGGLTVTQPISGQMFTRGQDLPIAWNYPVTPNSASMLIELYTASGTDVGPIAVSNSTTGSYTWHIPGFPQNYMCTMQYPNGLCGTNIPTGQYYIKVSAMADAFNANSTVYATGQSGIFTINQQ